MKLYVVIILSPNYETHTIHQTIGGIFDDEKKAIKSSNNQPEYYTMIKTYNLNEDIYNKFKKENN